MKQLYFLGPKGTYSEDAANKINEYLKEYNPKTVSTISKIVDLVNKNDDCIGIIPIENSIDGIVRPSIDNIYATDVKIQAQLEVEINHCLISKNNNIKNIKHIISHPQALAQCQKFILNNFDENIDLISADSTASSGYALLDYDESYGAIVSKKLAESMGLFILDKNISDNKDNKTRFVLISKFDINLGKKTRTSFVFNTKNEPGALLKILDIINKYNLNLIYLESRPSKKVFGEYNFFADIDKGIDEINNVLDRIKQECNFYKLLGSYVEL